jgi:hypothetical protein
MRVVIIMQISRLHWAVAEQGLPAVWSSKRNSHPGSLVRCRGVIKVGSCDLIWDLSSDVLSPCCAPSASNNPVHYTVQLSEETKRNRSSRMTGTAITSWTPLSMWTSVTIGSVTPMLHDQSLSHPHGTEERWSTLVIGVLFPPSHISPCSITRHIGNARGHQGRGTKGLPQYIRWRAVRYISQFHRFFRLEHCRHHISRRLMRLGFYPSRPFCAIIIISFNSIIDNSISPPL